MIYAPEKLWGGSFWLFRQLPLIPADDMTDTRILPEVRGQSQRDQSAGHV